MSSGSLIPLLGAVTAGSVPCSEVEWPLWEAYVDRFVSEDGRVMEHSAGDRTTSEAQAYAMFFALVANDRETFERLLEWTENNLASGDLSKNLPAWQWGEDERGRWQVLDDNSASDADLWLIYVLHQSDRLWTVPRHRRLAAGLTVQVLEKEVVLLPEEGPMLLPGARGFDADGTRPMRLNPSYLPVQLLRGLAAESHEEKWSGLIENTVRLIRAVSRRGLVPDWASYDEKLGFTFDPKTGATGSYDAIRVYLWSGMLPEEEPHRPELLSLTGGLLRAWRRRGRVPERVDVRTGQPQSDRSGPIGFYAALLPAARALGDGETLTGVLARVRDGRTDGLFGDPPSYYDQNLLLFALGYLEGRYRFSSKGHLQTEWEQRCERR